MNQFIKDSGSLSTIKVRFKMLLHREVNYQ